MSLHKLTAGDGYLYLVHQVAVADSTERGRSALADYYSAKGESPGRWVGSGLAALSHTGARPVSAQAVEEIWAVAAGSQVSEAQMAALFGEGLHPNTDAISPYLTARGVHEQAAMDATRLGRRFHIRDGETSFQRTLAATYRDHNIAAGQTWNAPIDAATRAEIRTAVAREKFAAEFGHPPADERELSGFIARATRALTTAVAGYDLTFSPVKSVSALWALAPRAVAEVIEECQDAAVADALAFVESSGAFTRSGTNGVAQVDTTGLIAAMFTHRDSRAGDPDLHTHVAVSNKVATIDANGVQRWLALDGQPLHRITVAASELYNTRLEAHVQQRLGVRFAETTPAGRGKRPVREIVGVPAELLQRWSSRRMAIQARTAELSKQFQATHGREPTNVEAIALAQQATLESREAKHEPRSLAEQRHAWRAEAIEVLGGRHELTATLGEILSTPHHAVEPAAPQWIAEQAATIIDVVAATRSSWQRHHVLAEAQRLVRTSGHANDPTLANRITDAALAQPFAVPHARIDDGDLDEPATLRRRNGDSVYTRSGIALYTSTKTLAAEHRILAAATRTGGRRASTEDVELALADSAARGKALNPGQAALVAEMATTGRRVALALAPAGTGKTTAMAALSHTWRSSGGHVVGLAPTAAAAIELATDLNAPTDTVAKYVHLTRSGPTRTPPGWFDRIDHTTLVIIDEAGKAGTLELDAVIAHALAKGASVRLVGDDGQLASLSAGGVLRDIAAETDALTLSQLVRFTSAAEGAASLALRAGDPAGIGYYIDHHRVHVGAEETAAEMAYTAWRTDIIAGRESLLLAPTNDTVDALNARARCDRLTTETSSTQPGKEAVLADKLAASAGDLVRARRNARWLRLGRRGDFVRNGYRFHILAVRDDGGLRVRHLGSGCQLDLPADYVAAHLTLGYAATIDSAQGLTAGHACHVVGAEHLTRQLLYVALTRGKVENHIYLSTAEADPHRVLSPKATHPDTAVDVLSRALARDGAQVSATSVDRAARDPFTRLGAAADMYDDALGTAAEQQRGATRLAELNETAELLVPGVTAANAWPVLRKHLALVAAAGVDALTVLADAVDQGPLDNAVDAAAVLDWRIDPTGRHSTGIGPLRWLPAIPDALREHSEWGPYLSRRADLVADLADQIRGIAREWTPATVPAWAKHITAADPVLAAEIAVFRAAHAVAPEDTRLLGPEQYAACHRAIQQLLETHATTAIGRRHPDTARWRQLIDSIDPRIHTDTYWPQLAARLADAARSRPDLADLVKAAATDKPLPDELPAAALWWRLCTDLAPATLDTSHARLRPPWIADLHDIFGSATAETITADPAWPGLVAAITATDSTCWTPRDLIQLAAEHLADADEDIAPYDFARLITYSIELITSHPHGHSIPAPEMPPLTPEEEEQCPPDLNHVTPGIDTAVTQFAANPALFNTGGHQHDQRLGGLQFDDLPATRPTPEPEPVLANIHQLRDEYAQALASLVELESHVRDGNGPAVQQAMPHIAEMRARAEADRLHLLAVASIIAEWADAEVEYDAAIENVEWARSQLRDLQARPDADPLDIASAKLDITWRLMAVPDIPPAQRFHAALREALTARAQAAERADKIISGNDVDAYLAQLRAADERTLQAARERLEALRRQRDRAEIATAAAFAAAQTRTAEYLDQQRAQLDIELRVLHVAGRYQDTRPLRLPAAEFTGLPTSTAQALTRLAELPFTVTPVCAVAGKERTAALQILHAAASGVDRKILWCTTDEHTQQVRTDNLADTATTITTAHQQIRSGQWQLPAGALLIIDEAANADPVAIADLAEHAAANHVGLILLDTSTNTWPPGPSTRLLRLLQAELPWSLTLGSVPHIAPSPHPLDLDPALTHIRRLAPDLVNTELRDALARQDRIRTANTAAYQRHLNATWIRTQHRDVGIDLDRDASVDLTDN
ncbi:MAG: relaxase domain-containing protein [Mycobacteriaceae bacterium]|nr:relaxase domain-containing protein [Mycobacteriaceae bacterium]